MENVITDFSPKNIITQLMSNPNATFPQDAHTTTTEFRAKLRDLKTWIEGVQRQFERPDLDAEEREYLRQNFAHPNRFPGFNPALFRNAIFTLETTRTQSPGAAGGRRKSRSNRKRKSRRQRR
uniref:Uncharacterized protein n=1 Tax=viral metagenome TaxID=1070528 RepID=A0A6C0B978_9ZZZZ